MADLIQCAFSKVCSIFKINDLNTHQKEAIMQLVLEERDVFISLPTGFGKSIIFQALPLVFDECKPQSTGHIVIVISPLLSLIEDQIHSLRHLGIKCISLTDTTEEERKQVERGDFTVVYTTPEGLLKNERWRRMISSDVYSQKLCAIAVDEAHVIKQW